MKNQKVGTVLGAGILIIFSVTVFAFVWKYEENFPQAQSQSRVQYVKSNTINSAVSNGKINQENTENEDCSVYQDERRICKDGTLVGTFDLECRTIFCPVEKTDESEETSYYSPFIKKDGNIFVEGQYKGDRSIAIIGADAATFRSIGICGSLEMSSSYYGKDKNHVYVGGEPVDVINSDSFQYLALLRNGYGLPYSRSISTDKNHVYIGCGTVVNSVDRNSLSLLGRGYFKDKNRVYYIDTIVGAADYRTFEIPSTFEDRGSQSHLGNFAMDKNHVFVEGQVLTGVDPKVCKSRGLDICLPSNWEELMDDSETEVLSDLYEE